jgi:hypothetical protein
MKGSVVLPPRAGSSKDGTLKKRPKQKNGKPSFGEREEEKLGDSMDSLGSWGGANLDKVVGMKSPLIRFHDSLPLSLGDSTTLEKPSSASGRRGSSKTVATEPSGASSSFLEDRDESPPPPPPVENSPGSTPRKSKSKGASSAEKSTSKKTTGDPTPSKHRRGRKKESSSNATLQLVGEDWGHLSLSDHPKSMKEHHHHQHTRKSPKSRRKHHQHKHQQAGADTSNLRIGNDGWGNLELSDHQKTEDREVRKSPKARRKHSARTAKDEHGPEDENENRHTDGKPTPEKQRLPHKIKYIPAPSKPVKLKGKNEESPLAYTPIADWTGAVRTLDGEQPARGQTTPEAVVSPVKSRSPRKGRMSMPSPRILLSNAAKSLASRRYFPAFRTKDEDEMCPSSLLESTVETVEMESDLNSSAPDFYYRDLAVAEDSHSQPKPSSMRNLRSPASGPLTSPNLRRGKKKKKPHNLLPPAL